MSKKSKDNIGLPKIVKEADWRKALDKIRVKEKKATRASDALAAERRRLPMTRIEKNYTFVSPSGKVSLLDLFENRKQLIIYHFMFAPGVGGWPTAGCDGCSMMVDQFGHLAHVHARDISVCLVSVAPLKSLLQYQKRMGWNIPWVSSSETDFNFDFGLSTPKGEIFGLSVFFQDKGNVYRTYHTAGRGVETLGPVWSFLDITPFGRQETWEDSPPGRPQSDPYSWWRRHDEYGKKSAKR